MTLIVKQEEQRKSKYKPYYVVFWNLWIILGCFLQLISTSVPFNSVDPNTPKLCLDGSITKTIVVEVLRFLFFSSVYGFLRLGYWWLEFCDKRKREKKRKRKIIVLGKSIQKIDVFITNWKTTQREKLCIESKIKQTLI